MEFPKSSEFPSVRGMWEALEKFRKTHGVMWGLPNNLISSEYLSGEKALQAVETMTNELVRLVEDEGISNWFLPLIPGSSFLMYAAVIATREKLGDTSRISLHLIDMESAKLCAPTKEDRQVLNVIRATEPTVLTFGHVLEQTGRSYLGTIGSAEDILFEYLKDRTSVLYYHNTVGRKYPMFDRFLKAIRHSGKTTYSHYLEHNEVAHMYNF